MPESEGIEARITGLERDQRSLSTRLAEQMQYAVDQALRDVGGTLTDARRRLFASKADLDEARRGVAALTDERRPDGAGFRRRREALEAQVADARERLAGRIDDLEQALGPVNARIRAQEQPAASLPAGDAPWQELNVLGAARRHFEADVTEVERTQRELAAHLVKQARAAAEPAPDRGSSHADSDGAEQRLARHGDSYGVFTWPLGRAYFVLLLAVGVAFTHLVCSLEFGVPATPDDAGEGQPSVAGGGPVATAPRVAVIMNTGQDGIGPGGDGVPHYRECIADPQFLASDRRWVDGTRVEVIEAGEGGCFSWLLVAVDGEELWVAEEYVWPLLSDPADEAMVLGAPSPELFFHEFYETRLRLAVFRDAHGNSHWLPVEEFPGRRGHNGRHQPGVRGKLIGALAAPPQGQDLGYSWVALNRYGKVLGFGTVEPFAEVEASPNGSRTLSARLGWFEERGIAAGSYVELYEFPVRIAPDGTLERSRRRED